MSTRHLIAVVINGQFKVAQYGHYDGYPSKAGIKCLRFLRSLVKRDSIKPFMEKVKNCSWVTTSFLDKIYHLDSWKTKYPEYSGSTSFNILNLIDKSTNGLKLENHLEFAEDSLYCEWVWLIDFDKRVFEVYEGFNLFPLSEGDRFFFLQR